MRRARATRPPRISTLARKQGFNMLKSTAQWTGINTIRAYSYVKACTDANFQAVNHFSLVYSVVYFNIRGKYQLCYKYLAHLLVEHISNTTETLRIGAVILEEHQVFFGLQSQQPHDLTMCGNLYVQQPGSYPSTSTDYTTSPMRNSSPTGHHKPTQSGRRPNHNHH